MSAVSRPDELSSSQVVRDLKGGEGHWKLTCGCAMRTRTGVANIGSGVFCRKHDLVYIEGTLPEALWTAARDAYTKSRELLCNENFATWDELDKVIQDAWATITMAAGLALVEHVPVTQR